MRKQGQRVRITAQLIHAGDDGHLWSQTWDRQLTDIFAVQDEIAAAVPLRRFSSGAEIASVVGFLASDGARYITGAVLPVDGGLGMGS